MRLGDSMIKELLLERINQIGNAIKKLNDTLAVLALGSIGVEQDRLDNYSDLDFFIVVEDHIKEQMINDLSWLESVYPIGFRHKNTKDGYKFLFEDGIYGEFAVFGRSEIPKVVQPEARLIWKADHYDEPTLLIKKNVEPYQAEFDPMSEFREALTNLYVGLNRALRGEKWSGLLFIETYALDHAMRFYLAERKHPKDDLFSLSRRLEFNHKELEPHLKNMLQGYMNLSGSALSILDFLQINHEIDTFMYRILRDLIAQLKEVEKHVNP